MNESTYKGRKKVRHGLTTFFRTPTIENSTKIGRNELCPCGSGKKYKLCHLNKTGRNRSV